MSKRMSGRRAVSRARGVKWLAAAAAVWAAGGAGVVGGGGAAFGQLFVGANFNTGGASANSGFIPPDTMGAVGIDHYVEMINGFYAVYRKVDGVRVNNSNLTAFWTSRGTPVTSFAFDPRIVYDWQSRRYIATSVDNAGAANSIFLAASNTPSPLGSWTALKFAVTGGVWADYPTLGVNGSHVFVGSNNFPVGGSFSTGLYSVPKSSLFAGNTTNALINHAGDENTTGFTPQPGVDLPGTSTAGVHHVFSTYNNTTLAITTFNTPAGGAPTQGTTVYRAIPSYTAPSLGARQPGAVAVALDDGDGRLQSNVVRQGNNYWMVQAVQGTAGNVALRWYRIDATTLTVAATGTVENTAFDFIYPAMAVTPAGSIVIGFTRTGPAAGGEPSAAFVTGSFTGGATTISNVPAITRAGLSSYEVVSGGRNRWGDYSAVSADPTDPQILWSHQQYAASTNSWGMQHTEVILQLPGERRWSNLGGGTFTTGTNWLGATAPAVTETVIFSRSTATASAAAGYTVSFAGTNTVSRLSSRQGNVVLSLGSATLTLTSNSSAGSLVVGEFGGTPTLTVTGTGTLNSVVTNIAPSNTSSGSLRLSGPTWNNTGALYVAGSVSGAGGTGSFTADAGVATIGGPVVVHPGGTVTLSGSVLTTTPLLDVRGGTVSAAVNSNLVAKTITQTGGTVSFAAGLSVNPLDTGTVSLTGGALAVTGTLGVLTGGTVSQSGGTYTATRTSVAGGRFAHTGGAVTFGPLTVTASGLVTTTASAFNLGNTSVSGTGSLVDYSSSAVTQVNNTTTTLTAGGRVNADTLTIAALGTVTNTGGTVVTNGSLTVNGLLNQSSGQILVGSTTVSGGRFLLNGGLANVGSPLDVNGGGTFSSTGSFTLPITTNVGGAGSLLSAPIAFLPSLRNVVVSAGAAASFGTLQLAPGSSVGVNAASLTANSSLFVDLNASVFVTSGTLNSPLNTLVAGTYSQSGGTAALGNLDVLGSVTLNASASVTASRLSASGVISVSNATLSDVVEAGPANDIASLTLGLGGVLDLRRSDLVLRGPAHALSTVRNWVATGQLISSSASPTASPFTTLGVLSNDTGFGFTRFSVFEGVSVGSADILVKYTYVGDTDLNGILDARDFNAVLSGWSNATTGWENGDVNYDGVVDGNDWSQFLQAYTAFLGGLPPLSGGDNGTGATIPEPANLAWLAPGLLLTRRRPRTTR